MSSTVRRLLSKVTLDRFRHLYEDDVYTHSRRTYFFTATAVFTLVFLVAGELSAHFRPDGRWDLYADGVLDSTPMAINYDITFHEIPCYYIDIEVSDVTGGMQHNITKQISRLRLDHKGRELGEQDEEKLVDRDEHKEVFKKEEDEYEKILSSGNFQNDGHVEELKGIHGLQTFISSHKKPRELVFVDFYAPWCIWCQRLEPVFAKLGQDLGKDGPIYVGRIDCTARENAQACMSQHVHSFPTMMFYRHGEQHPFEAYHGERTVEAMKRRAVEIARGDPQSAADKKKAELHRLDGETGPPVGKEMCRIKGTTFAKQIPQQLRFHLTSKRHSVNPDMINATHTVNHLNFEMVTDDLESFLTRNSMPNMLVHHFQSHALTPDFVGNQFISQHRNQTFTHYLKVVNVLHTKNEQNEDPVHSYQYSHYGGEHADPEDVASVVLNVDLFPLGIKHWWEYQPFYQLVTRLLAVLGGAFSIINVANSFTAEVMKITIGKQD